MIAKLARAIDDLASKPEATLFAVLTAIAWLLAGPILQYSATWLSFGGAFFGLGPWIMGFSIQHAQKANTAALQRKVDELIAVNEKASNDLIGLEKKLPEELAAVCEPDKIVPTTLTTPNGFGM